MSLQKDISKIRENVSRQKTEGHSFREVEGRDDTALRVEPDFREVGLLHDQPTTQKEGFQKRLPHLDVPLNRELKTTDFVSSGRLD